MLPRLPVQLNPSTEGISLNIVYSFPNVSPVNIERQVTSVLESGFSTVEGIKNISSKSSEGYGEIILSLDKTRGVDVVRFEVATIIRQLYSKLPPEVSFPTIIINKAEETELEKASFIYTISGNDLSYSVYDYTINNIIPKINSVEGIDRAETNGANGREWLLKYKQEKLQALHLTKSDIVEAINNYYKKESLGSINKKNNVLTVILKNPDNTLYRQIPVKKVNNKIIYLNELCTINYVEREPDVYFRINGKNTVTLSLYTKKGTNIINLSKKISQTLSAINLPKDYMLQESYNASHYLESELSKVYKRTFWAVTLLLIMVLIINKSYKYLFIIIISFIANIGAAFIFYYFLNVEIELYSLAGITISLGLMIDNSILVLDSLRHQKTTKIYLPLVASTLTTIASLSLIFFLDEKLKNSLVNFACVIIINLALSLLVAFYLIPALKSKLKMKTVPAEVLSKKWKTYYEKFIIFLIRYKKVVITMVILLFGLPLFMLPKKIPDNKPFSNLYNNTLGNDWYLENVRTYVDKYTGGALRLFSVYVYENAGFKTKSETTLYVHASMERGATIHQMSDALIAIENYILEFPEIKQFTTKIHSADNAMIEIVFHDEYQNSSFASVLKSKLVRKALSLSGIEWRIFGVGNGFNSTISGDPVNFVVKASGYQLNVLEGWADSLSNELQTHPRIQNIQITENSFFTTKKTYEYSFILDKEKLSVYDSDASEIYTEIKNQTLSKYPELYISINNKEEGIRLESFNSKLFDIWSVENNILQPTEDKTLSLKNLLSTQKNLRPDVIDKDNQEYIKLIKFQYNGSSKLGKQFLSEKLTAINAKLPIGYKMENSDANLMNTEKQHNYFLMIFFACVVIYFICSVLFESLKQPLVILSVIPISFIGVFLVFYLFDFSFDQGGFASFILLSGINVNSSIFILYEYRQKNKTHNKIKAFVSAYENKIVPISLTILSTILGFIPFLTDGKNEIFWFALAVGSIGGLVFSWLAITIFLPVFCIKNNNIIK